MKRESFIVYKSFYALIQLLKPKAQLKMFTAIFDYGFDNTIPTFEDEASTAIWESIFPQLKANQRRYENGIKGGAPLNNQNAKKEQPNHEEKNNQNNTEKTTKKQPNENVNENVNVNDLKERKKEYKDNLKITNARTYEEIMNDFHVSSGLKPYIWEFIKHCQLNGKTLTNDKLETILVDLDLYYKTEVERIECLKNAVRRGYFDIKRG